MSSRSMMAKVLLMSFMRLIIGGATFFCTSYTTYFLWISVLYALEISIKQQLQFKGYKMEFKYEILK